MTDTSRNDHGIGIIGLGAIGQEMLEAMTAHPRFTVRAAWDPDAAVMTKALAGRTDVIAVPDAPTVLNSPGVDILYIASPPDTHADYAHMALDAGHALLCEKPLGVDLEASRALVARVAAAGCVNAVNFNHAAAFDAETVKAWLKSGELGRPSHVVMQLHLPRWPRAFQAHARWLAGRKQGGFTREMLSHWLFLSRKLLGDGHIIHARTCYSDEDGGKASETAVHAELVFGDTPAYVTAAVGGAGPVGMEYTLYASDGSVRLSSGGGLTRWDGDAWSSRQVPLGQDGEDDRARGLTQFAGLLAGRDSTCATMADALAVQELVEGLLAR